MRNLASIQKIVEFKEILGCDNIKLARVLGLIFMV